MHDTPTTAISNPAVVMPMIKFPRSTGVRNSSTITGAAVIVESQKAYADWRPNRYGIDSLFGVVYQPRHQMVIIDGQNLP